jgi:hypothetical protein
MKEKKSMDEFNTLVIILIFLATILLSSRFFYKSALKSVATRLSDQLKLDIAQVNFSYEQMVYLVSFPSSLPIIKDAEREDLQMEYEYSSFFFPKLTGIKVSLHKGNEQLTLAYLPIKDFRLPKLDQLLEQGAISEKEYLMLSTWKLIHPKTLQEIVIEVFKQMESKNRLHSPN